MRHPLAGSLLLASSLAGIAPAQDPAAPAGGDATEALRDEVAELRRMNEALLGKVGRLEKMVGDDEWLTETRAAEIRAIVQDTLADSASRAALQSSGSTAGWDKASGFFLTSADGNFLLRIRGQLQIRFALSDRDRGDGAPESFSGLTGSESWGWEIRRARLWFTGHIIDPSWQYELQPAFDRAGGAGGGTLENAWVRKEMQAFGGKLGVRVGQYKAPFNKEELVASSRQLTVERSLVSELFTPKWVQGLEFVQTWDAFKLTGYYGERLRALGTLPNDGFYPALGYLDSRNQPTYAVPQVDYALAGRAEWKLFGNWKELDDLSAVPGGSDGLLLGFAAMAQNYRGIPGEAAGPDGTTYWQSSSMWGITADILADLGTVNFLTAGYFRQVFFANDLPTRTGTSNHMNQWGFTAQAGIWVSDSVEPYVRWEVGNTDTNQFRTVVNSDMYSPAVDGERANVVTIGANWYPEGSRNRNIKVTGDVGFSLAPVVDFANGGANWLPALEPAYGGNFASGQIVTRLQLQLLF